MDKRFNLYSVLLACVVVLLLGASKAEAMKAEDAQSFAANLGAESLALMKDRSMTQQERREHFIVLLKDTMDFETIVRAIVGPYWRKMSDEERERYTESASEWVLLTISDILSVLRAESFRVAGVSMIGKDYLVRTVVQEKSQSEPIPMNWRVRCNAEGEERLIDMIIRGLSLVSAQRRQATTIISDLGIPAFLDRLDENRRKIKKPRKKL